MSPGHGQPPPPRAAAIVVLGARVLANGEPGAPLRARVQRAAALFAAGAAPLLVLSGGVGRHPPSEAQVMASLMTALGVPREACVLEEESRSTYENALYCARILRARGIEQVILVTDRHHLYRARQQFWRQGIDVLPAPALRGRREATLSQHLRWTLREALAVARSPWLLLQTRPRR